GILSAVGVAVRVPESALDAVTGLSGSGPAYVFMLAEALIDAGVFVGLARPLASRLAVQTLLGAARMLDETGESPEALRAAVTSPGGTTASGLRALEQGAVRAAVIDAVAAATDRSRELGQA
ncbi:MAG: pyrroline-5-carboxylate reductase, partial [Acidimicrobiaceae bacterium]|nr:pyrroline-5-carboxylate reductase [Acidimicrobiaceae bacterium]